MSRIVTSFLSPKFGWPHCCDAGRWLNNFISLLTLLPSKAAHDGTQEMHAFNRLWRAASHFITDYNLDADPKRDVWTEQIEAAAHWHPAIAPHTCDSFVHHVTQGRPSRMSAQEALDYLEAHQTTLFGGDAHARATALSRAQIFLQRLQALREGVEAFAQLVELDALFAWSDPHTGQSYQFNPRALYKDFKRHYAYETALCPPQP